MELSHRLTEIITRLSSGEKLSIDALAEEFGVSKRTIQRDLHDRLIHLPVEQEGQKFWIDTAYLGRFSLKHLTNLMQFLGLDRLYNKWDIAMLATLANGEKPWSFMPEKTEELSLSIIQTLDRLESFIKDNYVIQFNYKEKTYSIQPYRLMFAYGRWYLLGVDTNSNKPKSYIVRNLVALISMGVKFQPQQEIAQYIEQAESPWIGSASTKVTLKVDAEFADYFEQKKIFPEQIVEQRNKDGSLVISCQAQVQRHIFPHIRYWIPYVTIETPLEWQCDFIKELNQYLTDDDNCNC